MTRSRKWAIVLTLAVVFGVGMIVGLWLNRWPAGWGTAGTPDASEAVVMRVYRELSPSVVNIVAVHQSVNFWMQPVPQVGQGTGFVIDSQGHIMTNNHVVADAQNLEVTFLGGKKVQAKLVGRDPVSDLAIIKVDPFPGMAVAPLGNSEQLQVGQRVVAIGNPFGYQNTVTAGFVSALNRDVVIGQRTMMGMIQTDAAINQGNSGGPLIDSKGMVIGVNTALVSKTGGFMGISLAVPSNRAHKVAGQILKWGRVMYPWLGVESWMDLKPRISEAMHLPPVSGLLIFQIAADSPAAKAGLRGGNQLAYYGDRPILLGGDVILAVDNVQTPTFDDYQNVLLQKNVGDEVRLTVLRETKQFTVVMTTMPDPRIPQN